MCSTINTVLKKDVMLLLESIVDTSKHFPFEEIVQKALLIVDQLADEQLSSKEKQELLNDLCRLLIAHGGNGFDAVLNLSPAWEQCFINGLTDKSCDELYKAYCVAICFFAFHLGKDFTLTAVKILPILIHNDDVEPISKLTCLFIAEYTQSLELMKLLPKIAITFKTRLTVFEMAEVISSTWPRDILNSGIVQFHAELAAHKQSRVKVVREAATRVTDAIKDKFPQIIDDRFVNEKQLRLDKMRKTKANTGFFERAATPILTSNFDNTIRLKNPQFTVTTDGLDKPHLRNMKVQSKIPVLKHRMQNGFNRTNTSKTWIGLAKIAK